MGLPVLQRYVAEFLTDNTLGRTWYEMRRGETRLVDVCHYLVRRQHPIWLAPGETSLAPFSCEPQVDGMNNSSADERAMWIRPKAGITDEGALARYSLTIDGYTYAKRHFGIEAVDLANEKRDQFRKTGRWDGTFEEFRVCLFAEQRRSRFVGWGAEGDDEDLEAIVTLNQAICERWDLEVEVIPRRVKKDPRELRILDPACGSGHFLLYAFDLLLTIYDEAYDDPDLGPALAHDYSDRAAYTRVVPALILHQNLHGIDIDPRACQIAALALWLRAQRRWQELGLNPADRPRIRKSNIVCAEPMPGERDFLDEYLRAVDTRLRPLVRTVWEKMQLAGEAGSLLKIEQEIQKALSEARQEALVNPPPYQVTFYEQDQNPHQMVLTASADDIAFWLQAETKLLVALRDYARSATNGKATQRRLFADDAAQGFAFIDVCRTVFDVVLMNPPFGDASTGSKTSIDAAYPRTKNDVFAAFTERGLGLLHASGLLGAITSRTGFFLTSFQKWREEILLAEARPTVMADLGFGVLDAMVETAAYALEKR